MTDPHSRSDDQTPRLKIELRVYDSCLAWLQSRAKAKFSFEVLAHVYELHGPSEDMLGVLVCDGCEWAGADAEAPAWPCVTHRRVTALLVNGDYSKTVDELVAMTPAELGEWFAKYDLAPLGHLTAAAGS